jgi:hypothetical protein
MDFFFRKIVRDKGTALNHLISEIQGFVKGDAGGGELARERQLLGQAIDDLQAIVAAMVGQLTSSAEDRQNVYKVGLNATRLLMASGDVVTAWLLLRQAEVAGEKLAAGQASERDQAFYAGKVTTARWFARNVLPPLSVQRTLAESVDLELMQLAEESF